MKYGISIIEVWYYNLNHTEPYKCSFTKSISIQFVTNEREIVNSFQCKFHLYIQQINYGFSTHGYSRYNLLHLILLSRVVNSSQCMTCRWCLGIYDYVTTLTQRLNIIPSCLFLMLVYKITNNKTMYSIICQTTDSNA